MKRELGQYFTTYNPFQNSGFLNLSYKLIEETLYGI